MIFETDQGKIYYETYGSGEGILFLHGLGGSFDSMLRISDKFTNYQRVLVDLPCHGKSDNFGMTLNDLSKSLISLMNSLGHEKFYTIGVSLGSIISENMVINFPEHIIKSAFISPASHIDADVIRIVASWVEAEDGGASTLFSKEFYENHKEEIMEYDKNHPFDPSRLFPLMSEIMNFNILNEKSNKNCIMVYGIYDNLFGERMINNLKNVFTNCKIEKLDTGHAIHRENPEKAADAISSFFKDE